MLGTAVTVALILRCELIDPCVDILVPFKKSIAQIPPASLIAEAYILGLARLLGLGVACILDIYSIEIAFALAVALAPHALFLLLFGILLTLAGHISKKFTYHLRSKQSLVNHKTVLEPTRPPDCKRGHRYKLLCIENAVQMRTERR